MTAISSMRFCCVYGYRKSHQANHREYIVDRTELPEENAIRIVPCNGFDNIPRALKAELQPDNLNGLAIIADTDLLSDRGWISLRGTLHRQSYADLPEVLPG
jgi:hypothetical protein